MTWYYLENLKVKDIKDWFYQLFLFFYVNNNYNILIAQIECNQKKRISFLKLLNVRLWKISRLLCKIDEEGSILHIIRMMPCNLISS